MSARFQLVFVAAVAHARVHVMLCVCSGIVLIVGGAPAPLVFYIACCFGTAFLVSLESFVTMFGPGAVLFSFVAAIVLFIMYIIGPLPLLAAALVGGSTLFYLLLTGAPIRPHRREPLVLGVGCVLGTMAIATQAAHNAVPSAMGMTLVAALLSVAVSYYGRRPGVLGPFYSYERRASVLLLACIVASVLAVAGAEAVSGGSPVLSNMLLQFVGGFATAALLLSVLVYMGDLWEPTSPHMHRFLWVDNASIILYVVIPAALVLAYTPPGQAFLARLLHSYHVIALNLLRVSDVLRNVYRTSAAAWHVALVSSGLSIMSTLLLWHVTASNLALAPLFAQVSAAGSSRSTKIAVTFDRGPDPKVRGRRDGPLPRRRVCLCVCSRRALSCRRPRVCCSCSNAAACWPRFSWTPRRHRHTRNCCVTLPPRGMKLVHSVAAPCPPAPSSLTSSRPGTPSLYVSFVAACCVLRAACCALRVPCKPTPGV